MLGQLHWLQLPADFFLCNIQQKCTEPCCGSPGGTGIQRHSGSPQGMCPPCRQRLPGNDVIVTWHPQFFILAPTCPSSFLCSIRSPQALRLPPTSRIHHALHTALLPASGPWCPLGTSVHPARPITKVAEVAADLSSTSPGLPAQRLCCHPTPSGLCPP